MQPVDFESFATRASRIEDGLRDQLAPLVEDLSRRVRDRDAAIMAARIDALEQYRAPLQQVHRAFAKATRMTRPRDDTRAQARIRSHFKAIAFQLKQWDSLIALASLQLVPHPTPLEPPPPPDTGAEAHERRVIELMYRNLQFLTNANPQSAEAEALGAFPDIPLPFWPFVDLVKAAYRVALALKRPRPLRFLDIGCGGGTKVLLAGNYFDTAQGLEYDAGFQAAAARLIQISANPRLSVELGDALTFDRYGNFDLLYFYRPLSDPSKLLELERRILEQVPDGTLLLAPYDGFLERHASYGCGHLCKWLYLSGTSAEATRGVLAEAELMGPDIRLPGTVPNRRFGLWSPLLEASYANGRALPG